MLGKVCIKNNEVFLYYIKLKLGNVPGFKYDLGEPLLEFLSFDIESMHTAYSRLVDAMLDCSLELNSISIDDIDRYILQIAKGCPYLHFYTQALLEFFERYKQIRANAFNHLLLITTDIKDVFEVLKEDMVLISNDIIRKQISLNDFLVKNGLNSNDTRTYMKAGCELALIIIFSDIKVKRERILDEITDIIDEKKEFSEFNPLQKMFLIDFKRGLNKENQYFMYSSFKSQFSPNFINSYDLNSLEEAKDFIIKNNTEIVEMYEVNQIDDLVKLELLNVLNNELVVKSCKYCGNYFIPKGRIDAEYCDRVSIGETKSCSEIGSHKMHQAQIAKDPIQRAYQKAYRRMNSKARQKRITQTDFYTWSEEARENREKCSQGLLSLQEFQSWLDRDKKINS